MHLELVLFIYVFVAGVIKVLHLMGIFFHNLVLDYKYIYTIYLAFKYTVWKIINYLINHTSGIY
jgi:hypothetical protein